MTPKDPQKTWPPRLWHSKLGGHSDFQFWEKPKWTKSVPEPIEYLSLTEALHLAEAARGETRAENYQLRAEMTELLEAVRLSEFDIDHRTRESMLSCRKLLSWIYDKEKSNSPTTSGKLAGEE